MIPLKPIDDKILVREVRKSDLPSWGAEPGNADEQPVIHAPQEREDDAAAYGTVVAVGALVNAGITEEDERIFPGRILMFARYAGSIIPHETDTYFNITREDVEGIWVC